MGVLIGEITCSMSTGGSHTVCNTMYLVRVAAVRTASKKGKVYHLKRGPWDHPGVCVIGKDRCGSLS